MPTAKVPSCPLCVHGLKHTRSQDAYCQGPIMPCVCAWPEAHKESGCLLPRSHHALPAQEQKHAHAQEQPPQSKSPGPCCLDLSFYKAKAKKAAASNTRALPGMHIGACH